jgi:hypothetical protein
LALFDPKELFQNWKRIRQNPEVSEKLQSIWEGLKKSINNATLKKFICVIMLIIKWKYCVHMNVNGKMRPVETMPRKG